MSSIESTETGESWVHPLPARLHKPIFALFLLLWGGELVRMGLHIAWPSGWEFLSPTVWMLASLTLAIGIYRRLPAQNVLSVVSLAALLGYLVELLNHATQIPLGHRMFNDRVGPVLAGVAWYQPWMWVALAISGRGVARLILRPWRKLQYYGLWVMGVAIGIALLTSIIYEPMGAHEGWWWRENLAGIWAWYGAPVASWLGWGMALLLIYGFTTPWFLNKKPVKQPTDWHPLWVWVLLLGWMTVSNCLHHSWLAVGVGSVIGVTVTFFAIRGGRW